MKKLYKVLGVIVVIGLIAVLIFLANKPKDESVIKIGLIAPLTGDLSTLGDNYVNGASLALKEYQAEHPDKKIELVVEDDAYDSKKGTSAYNKLVGIDKVDAIMNLSSPTVDALRKTIFEWNRPFLQLFFESDPYEDNIYALFPGQYDALVAVGKQAKTDGYTKVSIVIEQISAYERFVDGFKEGFEGEVTITRISPSDNDLRTHALKVSQEGSEAIALFMGAQKAAGFIKAYDQQIGELPQLYFDTSFSFGLNDYIAGLGSLDLLEGSKGAYVASTTSDAFKIAYEKEYGKEIAMGADFGYDSIMLLLNQYDSNSTKWIKNIKNASFEGTSGPIEFDSLGERVPDFKVMTIVGGEMK